MKRDIDYLNNFIEKMELKEEVILVDATDAQVGVMEKLEAHRKGLLHRAFSVFIFNSKNEMLLQKRAAEKYHSPGLWTNACCSHPRPGENTLNAAKRRLKEEMGLETELNFKTSFIYKTAFDNGLTEHEFDHIYIGETDEQPGLNKLEVESFKWLSIEKIKEEIHLNPERFTSWFKIAMERFF
jgi:isopentenyl-diphosphate Delta-isomerase